MTTNYKAMIDKDGRQAAAAHAAAELEACLDPSALTSDGAHKLAWAIVSAIETAANGIGRRPGPTLEAVSLAEVTRALTAVAVRFVRKPTMARSFTSDLYATVEGLAAVLLTHHERAAAARTREVHHEHAS